LEVAKEFKACFQKLGQYLGLDNELLVTQLWDLARAGGSFLNWLWFFLPARSQRVVTTSCIDPKPAGYLRVSICSHKLFNRYGKLHEQTRSHHGAEGHQDTDDIHVSIFPTHTNSTTSKPSPGLFETEAWMKSGAVPS